MNSEQKQAIIDLRMQKLTPKQIARQLKLKVSDVSAIIKLQVEETVLIREAKGELPPIAQCLISKNAVQMFEQKSDEKNSKFNLYSSNGLASVLVARTTGYNRFVICTYLVDYWCLGVKDSIPPRQMNSSQYQDFIEHLYSCFPEGYQEISLEQAQSFVLGAVDYAANLGLSPHPDFEKSKAHLGENDRRIQIEFGRDGKPFFVSGPYDDGQKILGILNNNVGENNFEYILNIG